MRGFRSRIACAIGIGLALAAPAPAAEAPESASDLFQLLGAGRFEEALASAEAAHTAAVAEGRENDPRTIELEALRIAALRQLGRYAEALESGEAAARRARLHLGEGHETTVFLALTLGALLVEVGRAPDGVERLRALLPRARRSLGEKHLLTALAMQNLGYALASAGATTDAARQLEEALGLIAAIAGPDHPTLVFPLNNLGLVEIRRGNASRAADLFARADEILRATGGSQQPIRVLILNNLAEARAAEGRFAESGTLAREALALAERVLPAQHPHRLLVEGNVAIWEQMNGLHRSAERRLRRLVDANRRTVGDHTTTALSLVALGDLQADARDYRAAEESLREAVEMLERIGDRASEVNVLARLALARRLMSRNRFGKAEQLARRAYRFASETYGPNHPFAIQALIATARIYLEEGQASAARPLLSRALDWETAQGERAGVEVANVLEALGDLEDAEGRFAEAGVYYQRALAAKVALYGDDSPEVRSARRDVAWNRIDLGRREEALAEFRRVERAQTRLVEEILGFSSEAARLRFLDDVGLYGPFGTLGSAPDLARIVLQRKGLALDSILEERAARGPASGPEEPLAARELRQARQRLAELELSGWEGEAQARVARRRAERASLRERIEAAEAQLAREFTSQGRDRRSLRVQVSDVQTALPADALLIEFIRYAHYLGGNRSEGRYGAVVIPPVGDPKWIALGEATKVDAAIREFQRMVRGLPNEASAARASAALRSAVWEPLAGAVSPGTRTLLLSPDGDLNFVSFAAVLDSDGRFLVESFDIAYLGSGRDLLQPAAAARPEAPFVLFGDPSFGAAPARSRVAAAQPENPRRAFRGLALEPLPGTRSEVAQLAAAGRGRGWPVESFLGADATEARLGATATPRILHLATHGFVLSAEEASIPGEASPSRSGAKSRRVGGELPSISNPMRQSGLALAGASRTLEAWSAGKAPPPDQDGILTAEEVSELHLDGTWLTVLSACDTGLGEIQRGEGVLGLRRGFLRAGTRNLLFTLWPVADDATVSLMLDFYARLRGDTSPHSSLSAMQREALPRLRARRGLFAAIQTAGPFLVSLQGRPAAPAEAVRGSREAE